MARVTSIKLARGLRIFKTTYVDAAGEVHVAAKWYIEFRFADRPRRVPAFTDRVQSIDLARNLHQLVKTRESGGDIDRDLIAWTETIPRRLRAKLVEIGLVAIATSIASRPL